VADGLIELVCGLTGLVDADRVLEELGPAKSRVRWSMMRRRGLVARSLAASFEEVRSWMNQ
jgi:hypothetical protein